MSTHKQRNPTSSLKRTLAHHCQIRTPEIQAQDRLKIKNTQAPESEKLLTNLLVYYPKLSNRLDSENKHTYLLKNLKKLLNSLSDDLKLEFTSGNEINKEASYVDAIDEKDQLDPKSQVIKIYGFSAQVISVYDFLTDEELATLHPALSVSILTHLSQAAKRSFPMLFFKDAEELMENSYWYGDQDYFQEEICEQAAQYEEIDRDLLTETQLKNYCESEGIITPKLWHEYLFEYFPQFKEKILTLKEISDLLENYSSNNISKLLKILGTIQCLKNLDNKIQKFIPESQDKLIDLCFPTRPNYSYILEPKSNHNYSNNELGFFQEPLLDDETRRMESSLPECPAFIGYLNTPEEGKNILHLLSCADKICKVSKEVIGILETWKKSQ